VGVFLWVFFFFFFFLFLLPFHVVQPVSFWADEVPLSLSERSVRLLRPFSSAEISFVSHVARDSDVPFFPTANQWFPGPRARCRPLASFFSLRQTVDVPPYRLPDGLLSLLFDDPRGCERCGSRNPQRVFSSPAARGHLSFPLQSQRVAPSSSSLAVHPPSILKALMLARPRVPFFSLIDADYIAFPSPSSASFCSFCSPPPSRLGLSLFLRHPGPRLFLQHELLMPLLRCFF